MKETNLELLQPAQTSTVALNQEPSTLSIIQSVVASGINAETVGVMERLVQLRREEIAFGNKVLFNKAFFSLKKEIATLDLYADKAAKTDSGAVAYRYCSEEEIAKMLEPVLLKHGFAMLFGQKNEGDKILAIITLIHESGHEEIRDYAVRAGGTNRMKDATAADTGATTSAWRHLCIKMFGLRSRIRDDLDPRNLGGNVTKAQADELERRCKELNSDVKTFLAMGGAKSFAEIPANNYAVLDNALRLKERAGK